MSRTGNEADKKGKKFDVHIATEGNDNPELRVALEQLGFTDDGLVERGLQFDPETAQHYTGCPLTGLHMTKKVTTRAEADALADAVHELMLTGAGVGEVGYMHVEVTIKSCSMFALQEVHPFQPNKAMGWERFHARPRESKDKKWDIHLSFRDDELTEPMVQAFLGSGFYSIVRMKADGRRWRIFTIQGCSHLLDGAQLFAAITRWCCSHLPFVVCKFENTLRMERYGNPKVVPPTIESVTFKNLKD